MDRGWRNPPGGGTIAGMDLTQQTIPPAFLDVVPDPAFLVGPSHDVLYRNLVARTAWNLPEETISNWSRLSLQRHRVQWEFQGGRIDGVLTWSSQDGFRLGVLRPQASGPDLNPPLAPPVRRAEPITAASESQAVPRSTTGTGAIPRSAPSPTILVADDNRINRAVISKLLGRWKILHTIVEDGTTALQVLERDRFGMALLDWQMPGMDGLEVARRWRQIEATQRKARTPLVAVTSFTFEIERLAFLKAGIDDILPKPVRSDRLAAIIQKWTGHIVPTD